MQAVLALEIYNIKENLGVYDATLAFSSEILKMHADNFTEYALTLGKQSQGINTFRNNMQAMTAGSKLLGTAADRKIADYIKLPEAFNLHALMHERTVTICQQLASEINSDYPALFNEKKYKEL